MSEVDAIEFHKSVVESKNNRKTKEYKIQHDSNKALTVELTVVNRKKLLDELGKLPDEMLSTIEDAEDEEEAQEMAEEQNMLSGVNGSTVEAFENICIESMSHNELTRHHFEDIVPELSFEVLFEMGSTAIELSFDESGSIKDFQEVDSDKNS